MFSLSECLSNLLSSLPPHPVSKETLDDLVNNAITESKQQTSSDIRRSQWEFLLRNEVYRIADTEGLFEDKPEPAYYERLCDRLEIILTFTEQDACEPSFLFSVLQDLLETQTVESCSHIFSWIELRSKRLTEGMLPQKGKALVLLRALNDLLRRLSKTGNTTTFCGRILTFLSAVFPLGERSGVNLRGEYGPQWEGVSYKRDVAEENMEVDDAVSQKPSAEGDGQTKANEKMDVKMDEVVSEGPSAPPDAKPPVEKSEDEKKEEFYNTFWSLQLPFSRPPLFASPGTLESFKSAVNTVLPVIKEATVKERAMMGSKVVVGSLKRKRDTTPTSVEEGRQNYFFAKFLTSPALLDLEIADTSFRRQFLFQLLIVLSHLLRFTKSEKVNWTNARNRSLQMDFVLQPDDAKWVQDTISRAYEELRQTTPNGRLFADTVQTILEREKNWVKWKNDLCNPFDKEPLPVSLEESTAPQRKLMRKELTEYKHKLGSAALTEIWAMGYRDLYDLQAPFIPGDVQDFVKDIEKENARIKLRRTQLEKQALKIQEARARASAIGKPAASPSATAASASQSAGTSSSTTALPAPVAQRPIPPPPASSPPLHPSLPAKPMSAMDAKSATTVSPVVHITPAHTPLPAPTPAPAPVIAAAPSPAPSAVARPPELSDPMILKAEENKQRLSWLALRTARDKYLHHFGKIGNGDVLLLAQEIEREREREVRGDSQPANPEGGGGPGSDRGATPSASTSTLGAILDPAVQIPSTEGLKSGAINDMPSTAPSAAAQDVRMGEAKESEVARTAANAEGMAVDS